MAISDTAIVGYAETKIVEKSDRDVWELGAEILEIANLDRMRPGGQVQFHRPLGLGMGAVVVDHPLAVDVKRC